MRRELSAVEYHQWLRYLVQKPLPAQRLDYLLGQVLAAVLNQGALSAVRKRLTLDDVVPWLRPRMPPPQARKRGGRAAAIRAEMDAWVAGSKVLLKQ